MIPFNKNYWYAISLLVGTIVGAGIFGLPYAMEKSGFFLGALLLFLGGCLTLYLHLLYGEIVLRTPGKRRYIGFIKKYFSRKVQIFAMVMSAFGHIGTLLAYLVLGGVFLQNIFHFWLGGSVEIYTLFFFALLAPGVIFGVKFLGKINLILVGLLLLMIIILGFWGLPYIHADNLTKVSVADFFFPYGAILFSLSGGCAVPEMVEVLKRRPFRIKRAIIIGTIVPLFAFFFFAVLVIGIAGPAVTKDAISALELFLGKWVVIFGAFLGLLAVMSSFFPIGSNFKKILWYDYKINQHLATFITLIVPLCLFLAGARDFIEIISLMGVFIVGIEGVLMIKLFYAARRKGKKRVSYRLPFSRWMPYVLLGVLILGVVLELYFQVSEQFF